ncbi:MAG: thioredoxin family protein [Verrucomicrobia bacterium]|nr:thioredoxin family protein [Verrucomicrobiota bacterium]
MRSTMFLLTMVLMAGVHATVESVETEEEVVVVMPIASGSVYELSVGEFDSFLQNATQPVIVEFYATGCPPCKEMAPTYRDAARDDTSVTFAAIDVRNGSASNLMKRYGVGVTPTFVVFKRDNSVAGTIEGLQYPQEFRRQYKALLK